MEVVNPADISDGTESDTSEKTLSRRMSMNEMISKRKKIENASLDELVSMGNDIDKMSASKNKNITEEYYYSHSPDGWDYVELLDKFPYLDLKRAFENIEDMKIEITTYEQYDSRYVYCRDKKIENAMAILLDWTDKIDMFYLSPSEEKHGVWDDGTEITRNVFRYRNRKISPMCQKWIEGMKLHKVKKCDEPSMEEVD